MSHKHQAVSHQTGSAAAMAAGRLLAKASAHHEAGRLDDAERLYRKFLAADPLNAAAHYKLGVIASQQGRAGDASTHLAQALRAAPQEPRYWLSLVAALLSEKRHRQAHALLERFVSLGFNDPSTGAIRAQIVATLYDDAQQFYAEGNFVEAEARFDTILLLDDKHADAIHMAANIACQTARLEQAFYLMNTAISLNGEVPHYHGNYGNVLKALGHFDQAIASYEKAISIDPTEAQYYSNLAVAYHKKGEPQRALELFDKAIEINPSYPAAYSNLGILLNDLGRVDDAIAAYDKALAVDPNLAFVHSNRLFAKMYSSAVSPAEQLDDARSFGARFGDPVRRKRPFRNALDPDRKLKIGFVSADLRRHVVVYYLEPVIDHLDRGQFELFAYSQTLAEDEVTARLKTKFDHWTCIKALTDDDAAARIEADGVDILFDLSGHTAGNRLLVFARKPAPIQIGWLGYPGTSGLEAIDYRFSNVFADPPGKSEHLSVEKLWRLPDAGACYQEPLNAPAVIDHPPSEDNGFVTFGCFNRFTKVTDLVLSAWAEIMARVPNSRLLLEIAAIDDPEFRAETEARLGRLGIPVERVIFEPRTPASLYVLYNRIDIALDPFPYNGGTTSLDTLYMGVPFVALEGDFPAARMGAATLTVAGLPELIARSEDEYVEIATALALDAERLRAVRHDLRGRMMRSPHMDQARLTRNIEAAFRDMWRIWVDEQAR